MALRIALFEVDRLVREGLTREQFEATRDYLMKNVYVRTATADQQIGYALDSEWYGIGEYTSHMRAALEQLTLADVNRAIREYIRPRDLQVVMITQDAKGLRQLLLSREPATLRYDAEKPAELLEEDRVIGALDLGLDKDDVRIVPIEEVFGG